MLYFNFDIPIKIANLLNLLTNKLHIPLISFLALFRAIMQYESKCGGGYMELRHLVKSENTKEKKRQEFWSKRGTSSLPFQKYPHHRYVCQQH